MSLAPNNPKAFMIADISASMKAFAYLIIIVHIRIA